MKSYFLAAALVFVFDIHSLFAQDLSENGLKNKTTVQVMMQNKLKISQDIFAAMIDKDFAKIKRSAELLRDISRVTSWHRIKDEKFSFYATAFQNSAQEMVDQAQAKNYEAVGFAYFRLTSACMYCHNNTRYGSAKGK